MADSSTTLLPKHHRIVLKNGLEVIVIPMDNRSGVISTNIFYRVGSRNEVMGKSGIAHMLEHLNFKSTRNLKAGEFDQIVKKFGGLSNASTGFDYTHYYIQSSAKHLSKSLELFAELMQNLRLKDEEFQPERNVVAEERLWRTDNNPMGYLYFRLFNTAYVYHPYHWTPIGFMEDIKHWSIQDIQSFHQTYYQPQNAVVVIAGDIDEKAAFSEVKKYFEKIPNHTAIPEVFAKEPLQDGIRRAAIHKESEVKILALAYKIPPFNHQDQFALSALSEILSGGKSSRLVSQLVDKKRSATEIYAYNMDLIDEGVFLFIALANHGVSLEKLEKELLAQIKAIQDGKITQDELEKVRVNMKVDFLSTLQSSSSVARLFGSYAARGDLDALLGFEQALNSLTLNELVEVAKKTFLLEKATIITLEK